MPNVFHDIFEEVCGEGGDSFCSLNALVVAPIHVLGVLILPYALSRLRQLDTTDAILAEAASETDAGTSAPSGGTGGENEGSGSGWGSIGGGGSGGGGKSARYGRLDDDDDGADDDDVEIELPQMHGGRQQGGSSDRPVPLASSLLRRVGGGDGGFCLAVTQLLVCVFLAAYPAITLAELRNAHDSFAGAGTHALATKASVRSAGALIWGLSAPLAWTGCFYLFRRYSAARRPVPLVLAVWLVLCFLAHVPGALVVVGRGSDRGWLAPLEVLVLVAGFTLFMLAGIGFDIIVHHISNPSYHGVDMGQFATRAPAAEEGAGLLSRLFFTWFSPLMFLGFRRQLEADDLPKLAKTDASFVVRRQFEREWDAQPKGNRSVATALRRAFGPGFYASMVLKLVYDVLLFAGPVLLHAVIEYLNDTDNEHHTTAMGYSYVVGLALSAVAGTSFLHQYFFRVFRVGMQLRSAVILAVYRKSLRLSVGARQQKSVGEIVNIMSTDARRMQELTTYLNMIWSAPLQITLSLTLLWRQLGPATLAGVFVMIFFIPFNGFLASKIKGLQKKLMAAKDKRVNQTNEALNGIKFVKLSAWEDDFERRVTEARDAELSKLRTYLVFSQLTGVLWRTVPALVSLASFSMYTGLGEELTAAVAFPALALFNILRFPMAMLPNVINNVVEAMVSLDRVTSFLEAHEVDSTATRRLPAPGDAADLPVLEIRDGNFVWPTAAETALPDVKPGLIRKVCGLCKRKKKAKADESKSNLLANGSDKGGGGSGGAGAGAAASVAVSGAGAGGADDDAGDDDDAGSRGRGELNDIHLSVGKGSLVAIVGQVASGKSNLLSAMLGEMRKDRGDVTIKGSVAYVAQSPFILNASLKDNILFGRPFDQERYDAAVHACCLAQDIAILPAGDETEIGERGINLSGGQKSRVSLARAVYQDCDIYLFDDPLSAVDAEVGNNIFERCMLGVLADRTRVLVTHALQYVHSADQVVVMSDGRILENDSFTALMRSEGSTLAALMETYKKESEAMVTQAEEAAAASDGKEDGDGGADSRPGADASMRRRRLSSSASSGTGATAKSNLGAGAAAKAGGGGAAAAAASGAATAGGTLIKEEKRAAGGVKAAIFKSYASAMGGSWVVVVIFILLGGTQGMAAMTNWWLSYWSSNIDTSEHGSLWFLGVYTAFTVLGVVVNAASQIYTAFASLRAARVLHTRLLRVVLHARMSFFDTTPIGRLLNRFSQDIYTVDEELLRSLQQFLNCFFQVATTILVISAVTPLFMIGVAPMMAVYVFTQRYYVRTSRELKRLDSVSKSPIFAHFGESLGGTVTIRAYGDQPRFAAANEGKLDANQGAFFSMQTANRWLAVRLEIVGAVITTGASLLAVMQKGTIDPALAGLSVSYSLAITQTLNWMVRMSSQVETQAVSVERLDEYSTLPSERATEDSSSTPPSSWPQAGAIKVRGLRMKYRSGLDDVLKGIDLDVAPGEHIGICGRTGAGKSSFVSALFRLADEQSGTLAIDGQDITKFRLADLRSRLAIIPQEATLFAGTLRRNLDPFDQRTDAELLDALAHVNLTDAVREAGGLSSEVAEGGENWSHGQRQLICMARALLRHCKVVILDEATAACDVETDAMLQKVIRKVFSDCTVLCIAHRVNTILDSDRILVLDQGKIAELAPPKDLIGRPNGAFAKLMTESAAAANAASDAARDAVEE